MSFYIPTTSQTQPLRFYNLQNIFCVFSYQNGLFSYQNGLFSTNFFFKFQFLIKSSKTVLVQICLNDLWIASCATILQLQCTYITPLLRNFTYRLPHPKTHVFSHKTSYSPRDEFLRGVLPKVIFSKSSDDFEHFHILRFLHISHSFGAIGHWKLTWNAFFAPKFPSKSHLPG